MASFFGVTTPSVNRVTVSEILPQGQELPERALEPTSRISHFVPHFLSTHTPPPESSPERVCASRLLVRIGRFIVAPLAPLWPLTN